jgi:hypothetical protein
MASALIMAARKKSHRKSGEIGLLVAMLRFVALISRPLCGGVADPSGFNARGAAAYVALEPLIARIARFLLDALTTGERYRLKRLLAKLDRQVLEWQPSELAALRCSFGHARCRCSPPARTAPKRG